MPNNTPFLQKLAEALIQKNTPLHQITVVLPNKRGALYLKKHIAQLIEKPTLAPHIITIESWIVQASGLQPVSNIDLFFKAYNAYLEVENKPESFEEFLKWIPSVLHDFNEIDRHMIDADALFDNMLDAKTIENWGVDPDKPTALIQQFLTFWKHLKPLYHTLRKNLEQNQLGWQGMAYRWVAENLEVLEKQQQKKHATQIVFAGFNALNKAEIKIVQHLLNTGKANIFWDVDSYALNNHVQESGMFMRQYKNEWPYFKKNDFKCECWR